MPMSGIIDGHAWVEQRLHHLRTALEGDDLTDAQRVLIETEIDHLQAEAARGRRSFRRWLVWGGRRTP
jgi:hypothetical protein